MPRALADVDWKIGGVGDFNRDGRPDILWHHELSGDLVVWHMDGPVLRGGATTSPPGLTDVGWRMAAVADYNGDERPDIVWRHEGSGQIVLVHGRRRADRRRLHEPEQRPRHGLEARRPTVATPHRHCEPAHGVMRDTVDRHPQTSLSPRIAMRGTDIGVRRGLWTAAVLAFVLARPAGADVFNGNPSNYLPLVGQLQAGDTLILAPGTYTGGLTLSNKNGTAPAPIIIVGPATGPAAVFRARPCCNTVSITNSSYLEIRNLEIDGLGMPGIDAVKAEGPQGDANFAHHVTLENLYIHGHDGDQQTVGISTKCPAWDWVVRGNVIATAGTGMYFGNSDGTAPFVNSLIEGNLVVDTTGYNVQIKHQVNRPALPGMPASGVTTIRHNVFSKANGASTGDDARPNLLVGHWPPAGPGANDVYQIYGNFFWANPTARRCSRGRATSPCTRTCS